MAMIILKSERDLEAMRPACAVASKVLNEVATFIQPGVTTKQVDDYAAARMKHFWATESFLAKSAFLSMTRLFTG